MKKIVRYAPAKINLFLHITGKRSDGYHLLESLVAFTEYGDEIHVTEDSRLSLEITGKFAEQLANFPKEDNLVWKAAVALQENLPKPQGAKITLVKNLPVASGIGGGSSDAAAAIHALVEIWKMNIPADKLAKIALGLGSDVPVCFYEKTALMRGIGEDIHPIRLEENPYILLVNPGVSLATAEVFREFSGSKFIGKIEITDNISVKNISNDNGFTNILEEAAIRKLPVIGEILSSLKDTDGCLLARMSGSGATCFGIYKDENGAKAAEKMMRRLYSQAWCVTTRIK